jgi:hypothetical protein
MCCRVPVFVGFLVTITGCGDRSTGTPDASLRDSAGIAIVENAAARDAPWRLSASPVFELDPNLPVEQQPLDPTSAYLDARGRLIVGDGNRAGWHAVLVYDSTGTFLMKMGGRGQGPGEFRGQLWWAGPYRGDSIIAWDRRGPMMKVYGPEGGFARDVLVPNIERPPPDRTFGFSPGLHGAFADGAVLASSAGIIEVPPEPGPTAFEHLLIAIDPSGEAWDSIGEFALAEQHWDGTRQQGYTIGAFAIVRAYGDDLIIAFPRTYEYRILGRDGDLRRIVRKSYEPMPVEQSDIDQIVGFFTRGVARNASEADVEELRRSIESRPRSAARPAYSNLIVGSDGTVWIERYRWPDPWTIPDNASPTTWDIFTPTGEWLTELVVPARVVLLSATDRKTIGVYFDEDDVRQIVIYDIIRE